MDRSIEESKIVINFLKAEVNNYNDANKQQKTLSQLINVFVNASKVRDDVVYCLAAVKEYLKPGSKKFTCQLKVNRNTSVRASAVMGVSEESIQAVSHLEFRSRASELYIDIPSKFTFNL